MKREVYVNKKLEVVDKKDAYFLIVTEYNDDEILTEDIIKLG